MDDLNRRPVPAGAVHGELTLDQCAPFTLIPLHGRSPRCLHAGIIGILHVLYFCLVLQARRVRSVPRSSDMKPDAARKTSAQHGRVTSKAFLSRHRFWSKFSLEALVSVSSSCHGG